MSSFLDAVKKLLCMYFFFAPTSDPFDSIFFFTKILLQRFDSPCTIYHCKAPGPHSFCDLRFFPRFPHPCTENFLASTNSSHSTRSIYIRRTSCHRPTPLPKNTRSASTTKPHTVCQTCLETPLPHHTSTPAKSTFGQHPECKGQSFL